MGIQIPRPIRVGDDRGEAYRAEQGIPIYNSKFSVKERKTPGQRHTPSSWLLTLTEELPS